MKKIMSIVLSLVLLFCGLPLSAITANAQPYSGTCGDMLTWEYDDSTGTLIISGEGKMTDYTSSPQVPWYEYQNSINTIIISDGVTSIGDEAFYKCESLTSVIIPDSVTDIGRSAFESCKSLATIKLPDSVTSVGDSAFWLCDSLRSVTIPSGVTSIGVNTFGWCTSLASITIPNSVTSIDNRAFYRCTSLLSILVDSNNIYYSADEGVLFNKEKTKLIFFSAGKPETSYTIPDSVTDISSTAFECARNLTSITIPGSVTKMGSFAGCPLKTVTFLEGVNTIGGNFKGCSKLVSVTIPKSATSIRGGTFAYCDNLKDVFYEGTEQEWENITIENGNDSLKNATIHYNSEMPFVEKISFGADRFTFGQDITGYVGDEVNSLCVYTSKDSSTQNLTFKSSDSSIVEIGTITHGVGEYILSGNEHVATVPLKLKAEGTATITITSPEGISTSLFVVVHSTEVNIGGINQYTQEHTSFVNSNKYNNLTMNAGFYDSIWKYEEGSRNFTCYAAWDVMGRVGKFVSLDFYGAFETENPYDVVLVDLFSDYVNQERNKAGEVFATTAKSVLGAPDVFDKVLNVLKTSDAWDSKYTKDWLEFTDGVQSDWIEGVFLDESTFDLDDYNPELYKVLKATFSKTDKSGFEKVFKNIKNFGTIADYISAGGDVVFAFFDAYQKYLVAEALFETNEYVLSSIETIAKYQMSNENSELLLDALDPYWDVSDCDSAFATVCKIMLEDGFAGAMGNVVYSLLGRSLLKSFVYAGIHAVTGISLGALTATYSLTYICLDYLSGLGKITETHTLMNAAALLEKEYIELAKDKAEALVAEQTHQNAAEFDSVWGFLQSLEGYCYKTMSAYSSANKQLYTTSYVIETMIMNNPFYAIVNEIKLSEDLTACDSAIQAVVYLESEWVNANCHRGQKSSSTLLTVKCPTDVYVYDNANNLVLSIVDNKVTYCAGHITAFVDGDEKIFVLPTDQEYNVQVTATNDGTMDYAIKCFDEGNLVRTIRYDDVELVNGNSYTAEVPFEFYLEKEKYNLNAEFGTRVEADYDSLDPKEDIPTETFTIGDITGDDKVNIKDWNRLYEHINEIHLLKEDELLRADVTEDGKVNIKDWNRIYEHITEVNPLWEERKEK